MEEVLRLPSEDKAAGLPLLSLSKISTAMKILSPGGYHDRVFLVLKKNAPH